LDKSVYYSLAFCMGCLFREPGRVPRTLVLATLGVAAVVAAYLFRAGWPVDLWAPAFFFWCLDRMPVPSRLSDWAAKWNPGSVYLWHAPILLPAVSIAFQRLHLAGWANLCLAMPVSVLASLAVGGGARRIPYVGRYLAF
jgi:hypothetical protein